MLHKTADAGPASVVTPFEFIRAVMPGVKTAAAQRREIAYKDILEDPISHYVLSHSTIIASVDVDPVNDYYIVPQSTDFVNKNADAWERRLLAHTYRTFIGKPNYVNHVQVPALAVGSILDAVAINHQDSLYIHILTATHKKHDIAKKVIDKAVRAMSMGAFVEFSICSACGRVARELDDMCEHTRYERGRMFRDENGIVRPIAELNGHRTQVNSNEFTEASWVEDPAFVMAVTHDAVYMPGDAMSAEAGYEAWGGELASIDMEKAASVSVSFDGLQKAASVKKATVEHDGIVLASAVDGDLGLRDIEVPDTHIYANIPPVEYGSPLDDIDSLINVVSEAKALAGDGPITSEMLHQALGSDLSEDQRLAEMKAAKGEKVKVDAPPRETKEINPFGD